MEDWKKAAEELMTRNLEKLKKDLEKIRSDHISLTALEDLLIETSGKKESLKKLATLRITPQKELIIRTFEPKHLPSINKSIINSQLGYKLTKSEKEESYFALLPLTEEIRQQLRKKAEALVEEGKVALRNSRQMIRKSLKNKGLSQSEEKLAEKSIEEVTNNYLRQTEELKNKKLKSMEMK